MSTNSKNIIVVKIEYSSLSNPDGKLNYRRMERLAMILSNMQNSGKNILLVTSGAIALGALRLKLDKMPDTLISQQATAAIGQAELIKIYQTYFESYNQKIAQVLLTKDVIENELRKKNAQNTFNTLLEMNIIPIINENDTVSTDDIEWKDNYPLALNVAALSNANMMIIKSENEGEYHIILRGDKSDSSTVKEDKLIEEVEKLYINGNNSSEYLKKDFPKTIEQITFIKK